MNTRIFAFFGALSLSMTFIACKKDETPSLQQQLDEGKSITTLLESYPVDSFYAKGYAGGYIFHLESNGTGMVVGKSDLSATAPWGCSSTNINEAEGSGIGDGESNTSSIITQCTDQNNAADLCNSSSADGYSDWYLPSEGELLQVYTKVHLKGVGGFANNYYWTSTQASATTAQQVLFDTGNPNFSTKSNLHYVRGVRNF